MSGPAAERSPSRWALGCALPWALFVLAGLGITLRSGLAARSQLEEARARFEAQRADEAASGRVRARLLARAGVARALAELSAARARGEDPQAPREWREYPVGVIYPPYEVAEARWEREPAGSEVLIGVGRRFREGRANPGITEDLVRARLEVRARISPEGAVELLAERWLEQWAAPADE